MGNSVLQTFGKRVKSLRLVRGWSQEHLALKADLDRSYLSDIERGLRNVSLQNTEVLATALGVPIFQLFLPDQNIFEKWDIAISDLEDLMAENPSLRGFMVGYMAEAKLRTMLTNDPRITEVRKFDDHDRKYKHDLEVKYKGRYCSIEVKSLQTSTVRKEPREEEMYVGKFQCDASDKRKIALPSGEEVTTTCLQFGDFDVLAVNLFAFRGKWEYGFALNRRLPASDYKAYPEAIRSQLIKSIIPITWPLQPPFVSDIFTLLEQMHQVIER